MKTIRRLRRKILWLVGIFAAYTLAGFLAAPPILRQQLVKQGTSLLKRPVAVGQVRLNPLAFSVTVRDLRVAGHDGNEFAGWDELYVNFSPLSSLAHVTWTFDEIKLVHPRFRLHREADGAFNIADPIPPPAPKDEKKAPASVPGVAIAKFVMDHGEFTYSDNSRDVPFSTTFGPTSFGLLHFSTRPNKSGAYTFDAVTESGEHFAWTGSLTFNPLGSSGHVEIKDLFLPKYSVFHRDFHRLDLLSGRLDTTFDYFVDLSGSAPVARLDHGGVTLADLQLAGRGTKTPIATIPVIELSGLTADASKMEASAKRFRISGADISVTRLADGSIDWLAFLSPARTAATGTATAPATPVSPSFSAALDSFEIEGATVRLRDLSTPRTVDITIDEIGLKLSGLGTRLDEPVAIETSLRWAGTGHVAAKGTITPLPLAANLDIDIADIALRPLDPYLAGFANVLVTSGAVRAHGHVDFALTSDAMPGIRWEGDAGVSSLAVLDGEFSEPLAGFADLSLRHVVATTRPLAVSLDEIALARPYARVIVFPDKRINLATILKSAPQAQAEPAAAPAPTPFISLGKVTITGGDFSFTDRSGTAVFTTALEGFGGTIAGISSDELKKADVDLSGNIGMAALGIKGRINPLGNDAYTDIAITLTGLELPPFTPYSGRYAGYTIDKGKLSLDLAYHVSARELSAENKVALDQFYLGQNVDSPDAVRLPLKLALAILRDRNGRIAIDLPIRGNLDDPDFKYGRLVWQTLGNLLVKAATSPFDVLGGLFGGGHDLRSIDFASGSAEFSDEAKARLDGLAKALAERPGLSLEIVSLPQPDLDLAGLRSAKLDAILRARKIRELAATTSETIDPARVELTPEETARHLAELLAASSTLPAPQAETRAETPATPAAVAKAPVRAANRATIPARDKFGNIIFRRLPGRAPEVRAAAANAPATPAHATQTASTSGRDDTAQPVLTLDELRARVLPTIEVTPEEFSALAAERTRRIEEFLTSGGSVEPARIFTSGGLPPSGTQTPRVVFNLK